MKKIGDKNIIQIKDFLYITNNDGQKIYGDKIIIYQNCGIVVYKKNTIVSIIECSNIEMVNYGNKIDIFAKALSYFALSIVFENSFKNNVDFKIGDKVIRQDNLDATRIEMNFSFLDTFNAEAIKREYEYEIIEIININQSFKILKLKNNKETVQVPCNRVIFFRDIVGKNKN